MADGGRCSSAAHPGFGAASRSMEAACRAGGARQVKVELVHQGDGTGPVESRTINRWPVAFFLERDERGLRAMAKAT